MAVFHRDRIYFFICGDSQNWMFFSESKGNWSCCAQQLLLLEFPLNTAFFFYKNKNKFTNNSIKQDKREGRCLTPSTSKMKTFLCYEYNIKVISILDNLKTEVHIVISQFFYRLTEKNYLYQNQKIDIVSKMLFMITPTKDLVGSLCWLLIREKLWMGEVCNVEFAMLSELIIGSICVIWGRYFSILALILQKVHFFLNVICGLTR